MKKRRKSVYFLNEEGSDEVEESTPKPRKRTKTNPSKFRFFFENESEKSRGIHHEFYSGFNYNKHKAGSIKFMSNEPSCKISTPFPLALAQEATTDGFDICFERPKRYEECKYRMIFAKGKYRSKMSKF